MGVPHGARFCEKSQTKRHGPPYDNGAMVTTDDFGLRAVCRDCKMPIVRDHWRTGWWRAASQGGAAE